VGKKKERKFPRRPPAFSPPDFKITQSPGQSPPPCWKHFEHPFFSPGRRFHVGLRPSPWFGARVVTERCFFVSLLLPSRKNNCLRGRGGAVFRFSAYHGPWKRLRPQARASRCFLITGFLQLLPRACHAAPPRRQDCTHGFCLGPINVDGGSWSFFFASVRGRSQWPSEPGGKSE